MDKLLEKKTIGTYMEINPEAFEGWDSINLFLINVSKQFRYKDEDVDVRVIYKEGDDMHCPTIGFKVKYLSTPKAPPSKISSISDEVAPEENRVENCPTPGCEFQEGHDNPCGKAYDNPAPEEETFTLNCEPMDLSEDPRVKAVMVQHLLAALEVKEEHPKTYWCDQCGYEHWWRPND